ncbi:TPA: ATP/GTP-binding protein [Vibrio cholerae O1]
MISELELENFKCFKELRIGNLKTFNIISGKNNFGKTSILDAIFAFHDVKNPACLLNIQGFRRESPLKNKGVPFWVNCFKDMNTDSKIKISIIDDDLKIVQEYSTKNELSRRSTLSLNIESVVSSPSRQTVNAVNNELAISMYSVDKNDRKNDILKIGITAKDPEITANINIIQNKSRKPYDLKTATMITTSKKINKDATITNVSTLLTQKKKEDLISILKKIDDRISDIVIAADKNEKEIYLDIGMNELTEISMLGEGVGRALAFISSILVGKNAIILIDEIENGIHFSVIKDIISALILSAKSNNNQIFTTTHSNDVINAINNIENKNEDISYVRLGRDKKTSEPIATQFDMDEFSYSIENGWEVR